MEQEATTESAGVTRGQNVLYVMPHDWASIAHFLAPALERVDESAAEVQVLVVTADSEAAVAVTASSVKLVGSHKVSAVAATSARRTARLLKMRPAHIVAGPPEELLALVQGATLKLDRVKIVVLAWANELVWPASASALETLMAEVPKDAARSVVASEVTPAVDALVERYARRARREPPAVENADETAVSLQYVTVSASSRQPALRRLLDELDPASAVVFVRTDESEGDADTVLGALGYSGDDSPVRVARATGADAELVVLYDLPVTREELREAAGVPGRSIVALVQPRQISSLRSLAQGTLSPLTLPEPATRARTREAAVRAELRTALSGNALARELLALEPLLEEYDGIEIAAAALSLLEAARSAPRAQASAGAAAATGTRLFINVGSMDNVRPADLVGAIVNEAGVPRDAVGRIEVRDKHSVVEIATNVADAVISKLTGTMIRGRRVQARVDQEQPRRAPGGGAPRRDARPARPYGDSRGERPHRDRDRAGSSARGSSSERPRRSSDSDSRRDSRGGPPRRPRPDARRDRE